MKSSTIIIATVVSWKTKISAIIATSSTETELISVPYCAAEVDFLRKLAQELGFVQVSPTIIFEDNNGAIALGNSGHFKGRSKHIDLRNTFPPTTSQEDYPSLLNYGFSFFPTTSQED